MDDNISNPFFQNHSVGTNRHNYRQQIYTSIYYLFEMSYFQAKMIFIGRKTYIMDCVSRGDRFISELSGIECIREDSVDSYM